MRRALYQLSHREPSALALSGEFRFLRRREGRHRWAFGEPLHTLKAISRAAS